MDHNELDKNFPYFGSASLLLASFVGPQGVQHDSHQSPGDFLSSLDPAETSEFVEKLRVTLIGRAWVMCSFLNQSLWLENEMY